MTPKERRAIKAASRRNQKRWNEAVRALRRGGWELNVKVEGSEDRIERFIWSAKRGDEIYIIAADDYLAPLVELQRETHSQGPPDAIRS